MFLLCFVLFGPFIESDTGIDGVGLREETDRSPIFAPLFDPPPARGQPDDRALVLLLSTLLMQRPDDCPTCRIPPALTQAPPPRTSSDDPGARKSSDGPGAKKPDDSPGVKKDNVKDRPRDVAADRINKAARSRPIFVTANQDAVAKQAAELGKPVLWWSFWPDTYDTTAAYFNELSEAQHILMTGDQISRNKIDGQEWVVYQHRDGEPRWIKAGDICGAECATPLRKAWFEPKVKPGLTAADQEALLDTTVNVTLHDGERPQMLPLRDIIASGFVFKYSDYKALERKGLTELEVAYIASLSSRVAGGSTVPAIGAPARSSASAYGPAFAPPVARSSAYAPPARSSAPAPAYAPPTYAQPQLRAAVRGGG